MLRTLCPRAYDSSLCAPQLLFQCGLLFPRQDRRRIDCLRKRYACDDGPRCDWTVQEKAFSDIFQQILSQTLGRTGVWTISCGCFSAAFVLGDILEHSRIICIESGIEPRFWITSVIRFSWNLDNDLGVSRRSFLWEMLNYWLNSSWWSSDRCISNTAAWSSRYPVLMMVNLHSLSQPCSPFLELHRTAPREKEQFNDCLYPPAETKREISKRLWNLSGKLFTTPGSNEGARFMLKMQRRNTSPERSA